MDIDFAVLKIGAIDLCIFLCEQNCKQVGEVELSRVQNGCYIKNVVCIN